MLDARSAMLGTRRATHERGRGEMLPTSRGGRLGDGLALENIKLFICATPSMLPLYMAFLHQGAFAGGR